MGHCHRPTKVSHLAAKKTHVCRPSVCFRKSHYKDDACMCTCSYMQMINYSNQTLTLWYCQYLSSCIHRWIITQHLVTVMVQEIFNVGHLCKIVCDKAFLLYWIANNILVVTDYFKDQNFVVFAHVAILYSLCSK